ncbi:MAG: hypothetical protein JST12_03765 [Armatimonadetes bacterium]|nr:hypothetical protein [Armatimonadota bacterium]
MFLVEIQEFLDNACAGSMGWTPLPNKGRAFIVDICNCTPFPTTLFALVGGRPWRRKHAYDGF